MSLFHDLRFAVRLLIKDRWFTLVAALALALGMAANNAVFTFVNAVLLRGIPFRNGHQIMSLGTRDARNRNLGVSFLDFEDWRASAKTFSDMTLMGQPTLNVSEEGRPPERYAGAVVSANLFRLIGEKPLLGPGFTAEMLLLQWRRRGSSSDTGCGRRATAETRNDRTDDQGRRPHRHRRRRDAERHDVSAQHGCLAPMGQSTLVRGQGGSCETTT
jgi:hypothetical protein